MAVYTVHSRGGDPHGSLKGLDSVKLVRDGFSWLAFLLPLPWSLFKGMWIVFAFILALQIGVTVFARALGFPEGLAMAVSLIVNLIIGFEAAALYRWSLKLRGYRKLGLAAGETAEEAELRFLLHEPRRPWG